MERDELLSQARTRLAEAFGDRFHGVVLYGSEARGDAEPDSDIDLLVLLDGPIALGDDLWVIVTALYPLQLQVLRPIHTTPVDAVQYEAGQVVLYRNAKKEGISV